jgi:hypothetical protein
MIHNLRIRRRRSRIRFRRGTAVTEFILAIPLLAVVLGLTLFFGWGLMHKQQVIIADRYATWQQVETGSWPGTGKLNETFFRNEASSVDLDGIPAVTETVTDLVAEAGGRSGLAEALADTMLAQRYPGGKRAQVSAKFDSNRALWERHNGTIHHRHGREGITWRRDEVQPWETLRDVYYPELDAGLQRVSPPADGMADMIRGLYLKRW